MVNGVTNGYAKDLEIQGVGFKAAVKGKLVQLNLGYSHEINHAIPEGIKVTVTGGPAGDEVTIGADGRTQTLRVGAAESATAELATGPGFAWYDTFVHVLHLRSTRSAPLPGADRTVGAFVHLDLEVDVRQH